MSDTDQDGEKTTDQDGEKTTEQSRGKTTEARIRRKELTSFQLDENQIKSAVIIVENFSQAAIISSRLIWTSPPRDEILPLLIVHHSGKKNGKGNKKREGERVIERK